MADKYTQKDRDSMAKKGQAMDDGSYPIADAEDLDNAIHAVGRGGADHDKIRKHIIGRAKALGLSSKIPDNWNSDGSLRSYDRKRRAELLRGREVRRYPAGMETRAADGMLHFRGVASTTEVPYDMGFYQETIKRGAFGTTLSQSPDVQLLLNHEGLPMARTTNGSLTLREEDAGLMWEAQADEDDPDAARAARKIGSGLLDQCSFAFRVTRQTWDEDYENREITEVNLDRGDVSIVNYGANPNTSVSLRSLFAEFADVPDTELDALRDDPAVVTILRRLVPPHRDDPPAPAAVSLDTHKARALVLKLAKS